METETATAPTGDDALGIGPTVELVPGNGRHANGNGNGHHDETPEPQQSLFSWAEFMGRGAGQAQGPGPQAPARNPFDVRVGNESGTGTGGRAGRRRALGRKHNRGRTPRFGCPPPASPCMSLSQKRCCA